MRSAKTKSTRARNVSLAALAIAFATTTSAGVGDCDPEETVEHDAVDVASVYVLHAATLPGPWVAIAIHPSVIPVEMPDGSIVDVPMLAFAPSRHVSLPEGAIVSLAVTFDGPAEGGAGGGSVSCRWIEPCAMGFAGRDPREDMLACRGVAEGAP